MPKELNIDDKRYDPTSKALHWILAVLIISMIILGWYMVSTADQPSSRIYFSLHKSCGLIVGALVLIRIVWRIKHHFIPLPQTIPLWQAMLARLIHILLYAAMILMPITGYFGSLFGQYGVAFFGWPLPQWVHQNAAISKQLFSIHGTIVWVLVALIAFHILAALKHLLINKDCVFQRMWGKL